MIKNLILLCFSEITAVYPLQKAKLIKEKSINLKFSLFLLQNRLFGHFLTIFTKKGGKIKDTEKGPIFVNLGGFLAKNRHFYDF